jgi:molecular chaperone DnaK
MTASQKLGEKMYAGMQGSGAEAAAQAAAGAAGGAQQPAAGAKNDDVVDADYKEVKRG